MKTGIVSIETLYKLVEDQIAHCDEAIEKMPKGYSENLNIVKGTWETMKTMLDDIDTDTLSQAIIDENKSFIKTMYSYEGNHYLTTLSKKHTDRIEKLVGIRE